VAALVAILLILSFVRIYTRNRVWHDNATLYERTLQQQPNAVYIRVNLAAVYWGSGQQERAIEEWRQAHLEAPKFVPPLINLAMASVLRRDWTSAEQYLQKVFELSPNESGALLWYARMREAQGRNDEAEQLFLRAEESAPYDPSPYAELGELYFKQNRLAEAAKQLRVSAVGMNDPLYWDRLGNIYFQLGQLQEAEDAFHSALDANPYFSESNVGLGQIYERRGDATAAQENYKKGLKDNPNNPVALAGLARLNHNRAP
jgi:tetratricopeptide (TPR) repeat protein